MQARAKEAPKGKSSAPGVFLDKRRGRWRVRTLERWNSKRYSLGSASTREEAEAIQQSCFPRLQAAADDGRFDEEVTAVKAELTAQVRWSCYLLLDSSVAMHRVATMAGKPIIPLGGFVTCGASTSHWLCMKCALLTWPCWLPAGRCTMTVS